MYVGQYPVRECIGNMHQIIVKLNYRTQIRLDSNDVQPCKVNNLSTLNECS